MYRLYVTYLYQTVFRASYNDLDDAKAYYEMMKNKYKRAGYGLDEEYAPSIETKTDEEWTYEMTRIPFYGRSGDALSGEVSITPTGMTDMITIHLDMRAKQPLFNEMEVHERYVRPVVEPCAAAPYELWIHYALDDSPGVNPNVEARVNGDMSGESSYFIKECIHAGYIPFSDKDGFGFFTKDGDRFYVVRKRRI